MTRGTDIPTSERRRTGLEDRTVDWWMWILVIIAVIVLIVAVALVVQARRRSGGVIAVSDTKKPTDPGSQS